jgi:hypothetical protein
MQAPEVLHPASREWDFPDKRRCRAKNATRNTPGFVETAAFPFSGQVNAFALVAAL